jgi:ABC-type uncharacterized transport system permease subunit
MSSLVTLYVKFVISVACKVTFRYKTHVTNFEYWILWVSNVKQNEILLYANSGSLNEFYK